ncbi:hypothetical protein K0M31_012687 [Melipona bicolor]|uniref:Uncharacterized protein n=1 Tax=Melipona bicolor TaxID=60889 RepID=A0AA40FIX9_9HYME|nr:hypothetical protein K0M31_012687 [Melipona bicolor]
MRPRCEICNIENITPCTAARLEFKGRRIDLLSGRWWKTLKNRKLLYGGDERGIRNEKQRDEEKKDTMVGASDQFQIYPAYANSFGVLKKAGKNERGIGTRNKRNGKKKLRKKIKEDKDDEDRRSTIATNKSLETDYRARMGIFTTARPSRSKDQIPLSKSSRISRILCTNLLAPDLDHLVDSPPGNRLEPPSSNRPGESSDRRSDPLDKQTSYSTNPSLFTVYRSCSFPKPVLRPFGSLACSQDLTYGEGGHNWRSIIFSLLVIGFVIAGIVTAIYLLGYVDELLYWSGRRLTLDECLRDDLTPHRLTPTWIAHDKFVYQADDGSLTLLDTSNNSVALLVSNHTLVLIEIYKTLCLGLQFFTQVSLIRLEYDTNRNRNLADNLAPQFDPSMHVYQALRSESVDRNSCKSNARLRDRRTFDRRRLKFVLSSINRLAVQVQRPRSNEYLNSEEKKFPSFDRVQRDRRDFQNWGTFFSSKRRAVSTAPEQSPRSLKEDHKFQRLTARTKLIKHAETALAEFTLRLMAIKAKRSRPSDGKLRPARRSRLNSPPNAGLKM